MEDIGKKREYRRHPELSNLDDEEKKREYAKMYYASHPEIREKAKQRARLQEEKEKRKKYWAKYTGDSEKNKERSRRWNHSEKGRAYVRMYNERNRKVIDDAKSFYGCMNPLCTSGKLDNCCLDFHHIDRASKKFSLGTPQGRTVEDIIAEIRKCIVLCANCHRLVPKNKVNLEGIYVCQIDDCGKCKSIDK